MPGRCQSSPPRRCSEPALYLDHSPHTISTSWQLPGLHFSSSWLLCTMSTSTLGGSAKEVPSVVTHSMRRLFQYLSLLVLPVLPWVLGSLKVWPVLRVDLGDLVGPPVRQGQAELPGKSCSLFCFLIRTHSPNLTDCTHIG